MHFVDFNAKNTLKFRVVFVKKNPNGMLNFKKKGT